MIFTYTVESKEANCVKNEELCNAPTLVGAAESALQYTVPVISMVAVNDTPRVTVDVPTYVAAMLTKYTLCGGVDVGDAVGDGEGPDEGAGEGAGEGADEGSGDGAGEVRLVIAYVIVGTGSEDEAYAVPPAGTSLFNLSRMTLLFMAVVMFVTKDAYIDCMLWLTTRSFEVNRTIIAEPDLYDTMNLNGIPATFVYTVENMDPLTDPAYSVTVCVMLN